MGYKISNNDLKDMAKEYISNKSATLRTIAKKFYYSKSAIHYCFRKKLKKIDLKLYEAVREKLEYNAKMAPYRGGTATAEKFKNKHN